MAFSSPTYPPKTATFVQMTGNASSVIPAGAVEWSLSATGGVKIGGTSFLQAVDFRSNVAVLTAIPVATTGQVGLVLHYVA